MGIIAKFYNKYKDYINILIGVTFVATTLNVFYVPNSLVTGGISGIGIIAMEMGRRLFGIYIPLWFTNLAFNIPLLLLSYKINGKGMFLKTLFAILSLTVALSITEHIPPINPDLTISILFGGALIGVGSGFVLKSGGTTGGTVLMAAIIQRFIKHFKITTIQLVIDASIIMVGFFIFGIINTMYAIVSIFITMNVVDLILQGPRSAKGALILSDKSEEISKVLIDSVERGITSIPSKGVYSGETKDMLLCVMSQKELVKTKALVKEIDPHAFIIITAVTDVLGNGFRPIE